MHGIINVIKPSGMTSQKVVNIVKNKLNVKKAGHLGTLDPSGTGVLPICVNKATKLFDYYLNKDKVYRAVFTFGKTTDTLDSDGQVTNECLLIPTLEQINSVLPKLQGKQNQIPPNYSRKSVGGVRAYELARKNINFELSPKQIEIYSLKVIKQINEKSFLFEIHCSSGTYVRSIARDLAKELNTIAYMGAIIRLNSGEFGINNGILLDEIEENKVLPLNEILTNYEKIEIDAKNYEKLLNGVKIYLDKSINKEDVVIYCNKELFGIANIENGLIKIKTNLR